MTNHDLGVGKQRGEPLGIAVIFEDLRLQVRFHLGKDTRSNGCSEMAEKQGLHLAFFHSISPKRCWRFVTALATIRNTVADAIDLSASADRPRHSDGRNGQLLSESSENE